MELKWVGPMREVNGEETAPHRFNGVPTRDLEDAELKALAAEYEMTKPALVKMLTRELPRIGALYVKAGAEDTADDGAEDAATTSQDEQETAEEPRE